MWPSVCSWVNKADLAWWQFYLFIKEVFWGNFQWLLTDCLVWMLLYLIITSSPWGLPDSSDGKESTCNAGDPGSLLGLGRPGDPGSLPAGEGIGYPLQYSWVSLVAQLVKNPPTIWETWAQSLGREESPGEGKGSLPTPLFRPGECYGLYSPWGHRESVRTEQISLHFTSSPWARWAAWRVPERKGYQKGISPQRGVTCYVCEQDRNEDTFAQNLPRFCWRLAQFSTSGQLCDLGRIENPVRNVTAIASPQVTQQSGTSLPLILFSGLDHVSADNFSLSSC